MVLFRFVFSQRATAMVSFTSNNNHKYLGYSGVYAGVIVFFVSFYWLAMVLMSGGRAGN